MDKLNYVFIDEGLLGLALTQSGVDASKNNERLEFIGDRVLGLAVAAMLYKMFPDETEGELARRHSVLVSADTLANVAKKIELDKHVRHGHLTGGRLKHIMADAMEAVLGAIYLDGGYEVAQSVIADIWTELAAATVDVPKDPKTALQEFVQHNDNGKLSVYEYMKPVGASHTPLFTVRVSAMGKSAKGQGSSKKAASLAAADELLKILAK